VTIDIKITSKRDFWDRSSAVVSNCPKMGQSQRGVEEGGFESGGVGITEISTFLTLKCISQWENKFTCRGGHWVNY